MWLVEPAELLTQLVQAADDLGGLAAPGDTRAQLVGMCRTLRLGVAAAACSIARLDGDELVYEAADGEGAAEIVGVRLTVTRGLAGFAARTGQAMIVDQLADDQRFARDVAERTGYVPNSLLVAPITGTDGSVLGVVSVLDRGDIGVDALQLAGSTAAQAALVLPALTVVVGLGAQLLRSLAAAVASGAPGLADGLREEAARVEQRVGGEQDSALLRVAALLAELRDGGPAVADAAERILRELTALTTSRQAPRRLR